MLEDTQILMSYDTVSFFTRIPTLLEIRSAENKLEADDSLQRRTKLTVKQISHILEFFLTAIFSSSVEISKTFGTAWACLYPLW